MGMMGQEFGGKSVIKILMLFLAIHALRRLFWYYNTAWETYIPSTTYRGRIGLLVTLGGLCAAFSTALLMWEVFFPNAAIMGLGVSVERMRQIGYNSAVAGILSLCTAGMFIGKMSAFVAKERARRIETFIRKKYGPGSQSDHTGKPNEKSNDNNNRGQ